MLAAVIAPGHPTLFAALQPGGFRVDGETEVREGEAVEADVPGRGLLQPGDVGVLLDPRVSHDGTLAAAGWWRLRFPPARAPADPPSTFRVGPGCRAEALDDDLVLWLRPSADGAVVRAPLRPRAPSTGYAAFGTTDPDRFREALLHRIVEYAFRIVLVGSEARALFPEWSSMRDAPSSLVATEGEALGRTRATAAAPSRAYAARTRCACHPINGDRSVPAWNVEENRDGDGKEGRWVYRLVGGCVPYGFSARS